MVFPTLEFLLFFAVVLVLNLLCDGRPATRKAMLIGASYFFYGVWDVRFLALMGGVTVVAWVGGLFVTRPGLRRPVLILSIGLLLGTLGIFKYANFFILSLSGLLSSIGLARDMTWAGVILPVGISFYVFQAISYVVDVARGDIAHRKNPADVALYISFFPQLVAGPIVRAADFLPQIDAPQPPTAAIRAEAVVLILIGLFKKMVVANYLGVLLVDPTFAFPAEQDALTAWVALLAYAFQIFCDFSGYSDIAIGIALLLGYRFQRNFNQPYRAASLREFWQRWHISLSSFIRDYLYIPLGGNRGGAGRVAVVLIVTMTLAGLWHGAAWPFVMWGFLHGAGLAVERLFRARGLRLVRPVATLLTFAFVVLLWLPFRAGSTDVALQMLTTMTGGSLATSAPIALPVWVLLVIGFAMNHLPLSLRSRSIDAIANLPAIGQAATLALGVLLNFALSQEGTAPFIYFQF